MKVYLSHSYLFNQCNAKLERLQVARNTQIAATKRNSLLVGALTWRTVGGLQKLVALTRDFTNNLDSIFCFAVMYYQLKITVFKLCYFIGDAITTVGCMSLAKTRVVFK